MKCKACGKELQAGEAVIKFEGLEMDTPVSVKSGVCYSGGVCHIECISRLETIVTDEYISRLAVMHAVVDGVVLCAR